MRKPRIYLHCLALIALLAAGCNKIGVFEKHATFPAFSWYQNNTPEFSFDITDTAAPYNLLLVCRHTNAYAYSNLWVKITGYAPGGDSSSHDIQMPLTVNNREWAGAGMDDIYEVRHLPQVFKARTMKKGTYRFRVQQIMRNEPLKEIINFGLRIEKINQ